MLPLDRSGEPKRLFDVKGNLIEAAFTSDGKSFVGLTTVAGGWRELSHYFLDQEPTARQAAARARGKRIPTSPRISPDGRWVLLSDFGQVYVRPIDGASAIEVINEGAGYSPT